MRTYNIARLTKVAEFGDVEAYEDRNLGITKEGFKPKLKVKCGSYQIGQTMQSSLLGLNITDSVAIVVRHNDQLQQYPKVRLKGQLYNVKLIQADDELNAFDVVTLSKVTKHG